MYIFQNYFKLISAAKSLNSEMYLCDFWRTFVCLIWLLWDCVTLLKNGVTRSLAETQISFSVGLM